MSKRQTDPDATTEPTAAMTATERLAAIDRDRAAAHATIDSLPAKERMLLESNAPDSVFVTLDRDRRRAEIALARADLAERGAIQAARQEHEVSLGKVWTGHRDRFAEVAGRYMQAMRAALALEGEMAKVSADIHASNIGLPLPLPLGVASQVQMEHFARAVAAIAPVPYVPPIEHDIHAVTLLRRHGSLNAGETVNLAAGAAWPMVDDGIAAWAAGTKPPRRPVHRHHRPITPPPIVLLALKDSPAGPRGTVLRRPAGEAARLIRDGVARRAELGEVA